MTKTSVHVPNDDRTTEAQLPLPPVSSSLIATLLDTASGQDRDRRNGSDLPRMA